MQISRLCFRILLAVQQNFGAVAQTQRAIACQYSDSESRLKALRHRGAIYRSIFNGSFAFRFRGSTSSSFASNVRDVFSINLGS